MIFEVICYSLSGFFMKLSDEAMDIKNNTPLAIISGIICVIFTLLVVLTSGDAACIFISILIGTLLASKIDSINHIISAIILVLVLIIADIPHFSWICLVVCTIVAFIDEKGNDNYDEKIGSENGGNEGLFDKFFKYRYSLKLAVVLFSMIGLVNSMNPFILPDIPILGWYYFEPETFIYFYLFDLCYEFVGLHFDRIYNIFKGFSRIG